MLDHTEAGKFTESYDVGPKNEGLNIYAYYFEHFGLGSQKAIDCANEVMAFVSLEFIKAAHGDVETAVCGADEANIFFRIELPALVENLNIKTINGISMDMVREFYIVSPCEAFRLICLSELQLMRKEDRAEYQQRHKFFAFERNATRSAMPRLTPEVKQKLKEIVAFYNMQATYDDLSDAASRPVVATLNCTAKAAGDPR